MSIIKNQTKGYYNILNDLMDKWLRIIGPGAFIVYQELIRFCKGGEKIPFPNVTAVDWAAWIGMSYPSFLKNIKILEDHGLIKVYRGQNKSRFVKESNMYEICVMPEVTDGMIKRSKVSFFKDSVRFGDPLRNEPMFKHKEDSPYKNFLHPYTFLTNFLYT